MNHLLDYSHAAGVEQQRIDVLRRAFGDEYVRRYAHKRSIELGKKIERNNSDARKLKAYVDSLRWVVDLFEQRNPTFQGANALTLPDLRGMLPRAYQSYAAAGDVNERIVDPTRAWREAFWFDVRGIPPATDDAMQKMGRDLVEQGIIKLPFSDVVFVSSIGADGGEEAAVATRMSQGEGEIVCHDLMIASDQRHHRPMYHLQPKDCVNVELYYHLAVINTKYVVQQRECLDAQCKRTANSRGTNASTHYFIVNLDPRYVTVQGGSHTGVTPRLHWRRGHVRRLGETRTTWVHAHLVGSKSRGVLVRDYALNSMENEPS